MLKNVKLYLRNNEGKLACVEFEEVESYEEAITLARQRIYLEETLLAVKHPMMALVQK